MTTMSFTEADSAALVAERLAKCTGPLPAFLVALIGHLHQAIRETRPTAADWRRAIEFLTEVGHASDHRRQEWVLLSDLLGVTALVEEINTRRPKGATPNTVRGPFYRADAPRVPLGATISLDGIGEPLAVTTRVIDLDGYPVSGATVETWQANAQGLYENQEPDLQPEFNLRGVFTTDADGAFYYRTVRPGGYAVPCDGPVGRMLHAIGYPLRRPAHLHFVITAPGFETISTHVYDGRDPYLGEDALFGVKQELIGSFRPADGADAGAAAKGERRWSLDFTFVMVRARKERRSA
ncbi:dioxygenase [Rhizobium calliandrae]|uniref:Dioxygenase n=1 Tax=Rhizobium calliandrae TaxID=1312182 RepID=A0ABT7KMS4_9HYPH|nr:dioxygenase [Rhizobium calliandrae]MDL2409442.1 dioxygenase [Rhizobium calliandrae]